MPKKPFRQRLIDLIDEIFEDKVLTDEEKRDIYDWMCARGVELFNEEEDCED